MPDYAEQLIQLDARLQRVARALECGLEVMPLGTSHSLATAMLDGVPEDVASVIARIRNACAEIRETIRVMS